MTAPDPEPPVYPDVAAGDVITAMKSALRMITGEDARDQWRELADRMLSAAPVRAADDWMPWEPRPDARTSRSAMIPGKFVHDAIVRAVKELVSAGHLTRDEAGKLLGEIGATLDRAASSPDGTGAYTVQCAAPGCGQRFTPAHKRHRACSDTCRKRLERARKRSGKAAARA